MTTEVYTNVEEDITVWIDNDGRINLEWFQLRGEEHETNTFTSIGEAEAVIAGLTEAVRRIRSMS